MATRTISKQGRGNSSKNTADKKQAAGRQQGSNSGRGTQGATARPKGTNESDPQQDANGRSSRITGKQGDNEGKQSSNEKQGLASNNNTRSQQAAGNRRQGDSQGRSRSQGDSQGRNRSKQGDSPLEKFFLDLLKDIYYAEKKITQSLPKMQEAATTDELKDAFEDHLHQTERHVKRLEKVFQTLGKQPEGKKCEAIEGIAKEVESIIEETEEGTLTRDAALIIAAQKVEHYEIATYGGLVQLAITMGLHDAADLLDKTLLEEEDTDSLLTEIAENDINLGAEHEGNSYSWDQGNEQHQGHEQQEGESDNEEEKDNQDKKQSSGNQRQNRQQRQLGETDEENEESETEEGKTNYSDIE